MAGERAWSGCVLVVGCGRLGCLLASRLDRAGHDVAVLDRSREALAALPEGFGGRAVVGEAMQLEALERAGLREAEVVIAALGEELRSLALVALVRATSEARVLTSLGDPARLATARALGAEAVCGTTLAADALQEALCAPLTRRPGGSRPPVR